MKKLLVGVLTIGIMGALIACGSADSSETTEDVTAVVETKEPEEAEEATPEATEEATEAPEATEEATEETAETLDVSNTLVVYFSATGNTRNIAEIIADGVIADIYEIVPQEPYSDADLDYNDNNSRSTQEMNDSSARPAISGSVENMDQYDTVYIGYPIWWGEAPRIVDTFVESYDFTDKTVITFCTSASSGMGSSTSTLESLAGTGNWITGERFSGSETEAEVMEWVNSL